MLLAVYIGIANGSFTVPFKYAQKDVKGIVYVVSFGLGAVMVRSFHDPDTIPSLPHTSGTPPCMQQHAPFSRKVACRPCCSRALLTANRTAQTALGRWQSKQAACII